MEKMIEASAVRALWLGFVERGFLYGETRVRWIACRFLANLEVLFVRPAWLDVDWLDYEYRRLVEEELENGCVLR